MENNNNSLFRDEAVEFKKNAWMNQYQTNLPKVNTLLTNFSVIIIIILISIFFLPYSYKIKVNGNVYYQPAATELQFKSKGVVSEIMVSIGDRVKIGQDIVKVKNEINYNEGGVNSKTLDNLSRKLSYLNNRRNEILNDFTTRQNIVKNKISSLDDTISTVNQSIKDGEERVDILIRVFYKYKKLKSEGLVNDQEMASKEKDLQQVIAELNNLKIKLKELHFSKISLSSEKEQLDIEKNKELFTIRETVNATENLRIKTAANFESNVKSNLDGVIGALDLSIGKNISPGDVAAIVLPENVKPKVSLSVPDYAIFFLKRNQVVKLKVSSFPFKFFGSVSGRIDYISSSPEKLTSNKKYFKVDVTIDDKSLMLPVGVNVEAQIITITRPIWKWLFVPISI